MGYVEKILAPGETVLYRAQLHWIVYRAVWWFLIVGAILLSTVEPGTRMSGIALVWLMAIAALSALLSAWVKRATTEIVVTNRRVVVKVGFIRRAVMEMNAGKIESLLVQQSVLGRVFDYGTVVVKGTGAGIEPVRDVAHPLKLRAAVASICEATY
jgi:hypothetical protein